MFVLFSFFSSFAIISSILVVISNNPVYSVLFLVLTFFDTSALLFLLSFEFLPVVFIVVYVGAIAVLFLFVIMTLSIKLSETKNENLNYLPVLALLSIIFLLDIITLTCLEFNSAAHSLSDLFASDFYSVSFDYISSLGKINNMKLLGSVLFTDYCFHFILIGMILLFAMIASIVLTLQKGFKAKTQGVFLQVLREYNTTVFAYK